MRPRVVTLAWDCCEAVVSLSGPVVIVVMVVVWHGRYVKKATRWVKMSRKCCRRC